MKTILDFIRVNSSGQFERVTWTKDKTGNKSVNKNPYKPTPEQLQKMSQDMYGELHLK